MKREDLTDEEDAAKGTEKERDRLEISGLQPPKFAGESEKGKAKDEPKQSAQESKDCTRITIVADADADAETETAGTATASTSDAMVIEPGVLVSSVGQSTATAIATATAADKIERRDIRTMAKQLDEDDRLAKERNRNSATTSTTRIVSRERQTFPHEKFGNEAMAAAASNRRKETVFVATRANSSTAAASSGRREFPTEKFNSQTTASASASAAVSNTRIDENDGTQPGAFPDSRPPLGVTLRTVREELQPNVTSASNSAQEDSLANATNTPAAELGFLVEASLVLPPQDAPEHSNDGRGEPATTIVVEAQQARFRDFLHHRNMQFFIGGLICCIFIAAAVSAVLGVVVSQGSGQSSPPSLPAATSFPTGNISETGLSQTANPTAIPIPSSYPTLAPTVNFLTNLPDFSLQSIQNTTSPQSKAYNWLDGYPDLDLIPEWRREQLFAMATLFYALNGIYWQPLDKQKNYLSYSTLECFWGDSVCNNDGQIVQFNLEHVSEGLQGTLPLEITLLRSLEEIKVTFSPWHMSTSHLIRPEWANLVQLKILEFVWNEQIHGSIPSEVGLLTSLRKIQFQYNKMSAALPTELGMLRWLSTLNVYENAISGEIPSELGLMTHLDTVWLHNNNNITGTLPTELGLLYSLDSLRLYNNMIAGTIPSELGLLTRVRPRLWLHNNAITGTLPTELGLLSSLDSLWLYNNMITGTLPSEVGMLNSLSSLSIYNTGISGPLPSELGLLTLLQQRLWLNKNDITGTLPTELGLLSSLEVIRLDNNMITGTLPSELGLLAALQNISLHSNALEGSIPSELGLLTSLEGLFLYNNSMMGDMPSTVCSLTRVDLLAIDCSNITCPDACACSEAGGDSCPY